MTAAGKAAECEQCRELKVDLDKAAASLAEAVGWFDAWEAQTKELLEALRQAPPRQAISDSRYWTWDQKYRVPLLAKHQEQKT